MSGTEKRLIEANIKLQDENNGLKFELNKMYELLEKIRTYIMISKNEDNKVNGDNILEIIGEHYE